ncbi:O-antigen ligase family protein [Fulvivirga ligni]|uniref:O-antigen ligase family protein n=1 Tax=Fulvivirga ligni TaxID=2904246 RepID=UPI001F236268|nr:O-antigen ligase family protein [Fulvivirga ligni]UII22666.1 O-antigen ligase family protein [Fulvivirga ligni]
MNLAQNRFKVLGNLFFCGLICFVVTMPLPPIYNSLSIVFLFLIRIVTCIVSQKIGVDIRFRELFYCFVFIFFSFLISALWSEHLSDIFVHLEKRLSYLVFPIIFFLTPSLISRNRIFIVFKLYVLVIVVVALYCELNVFVDIYLKNQNFNQWNSWRYTSDYLSGFVNLHPSYLSIYVNIALILVLYMSNLGRNKIQYALVACLICFLFGFNVLLASRVNFMVSVFLVVFHLYNELCKRMQRKYALGGMLIAIFCIFLMLYNMPYFQSKIEQTMSYLLNEKVNNGNSTSAHFAAWECSWESINSHNLWFGNGLSNVDNILADCYSSKGFNYNLRNKFNSHNQIFQIVLGVGVIGFIPFLLAYINLVIKKSLLINLFIFVISVACMAESVLARQKGIIVFMFFACILYYWSGNEKKHV